MRLTQILSGMFLAFGTTGAFAQCSADVVELRGDWGEARFRVEVADEPAERSQGLMFRESMPLGAGMIFFYEAPQRAGFWMKNTLIALDMLFVDQFGTVQRIHENAIPEDETVIEGGNDVLAVLELNGGMAKSMGLTVGSQLKHPSFDQENAVWPCDPQ